MCVSVCLRSFFFGGTIAFLLHRQLNNNQFTGDLTALIALPFPVDTLYVHCVL